MTTTASIYFNKIRVDYPQAGKDNDSQGFRDNFKNILNAFSATNADLESLKLNSVSLSGDNDFGFNVIKKASFQSCVTKITDYSPNPVSGNVNIDFREGNYQKFSISAGPTTFYINNWPSGTYAQMRVTVSPTTSNTSMINFGGNLVKVGYIDLPVVTNSTDTQTFDLWTDDGGITTYIQGIDLTPTTLVYDTTAARQSNTVNINYSNGKYQKFSVSTGTSTVAVSGWPLSTNTVALMSLSFNTTTTTFASTLTFANAVSVGTQTQPFTISTTATQFFDVWTDNGGNTVYVLRKGT